jgi:hypothetical protein
MHKMRAESRANLLRIAEKLGRSAQKYEPTYTKV